MKAVSYFSPQKPKLTLNNSIFLYRDVFYIVAFISSTECKLISLDGNRWCSENSTYHNFNNELTLSKFKELINSNYIDEWEVFLKEDILPDTKALMERIENLEY